MKSYPVKFAKPGQTIIAVWRPEQVTHTFYSPDEFKLLEQKLIALDPTIKSNRLLQRITLGTAQEAIVDENGRVSLFEWGKDDQMQPTTGG